MHPDVNDDLISLARFRQWAPHKHGPAPPAAGACYERRDRAGHPYRQATR